MAIPTDCPFCDLPADRVIERNSVDIAIRDAHPVSHGHTLVIPVRHVASLFDTTGAEREGLMSLLFNAKQKIDAESTPKGYNIGVNDGVAAGQTVPHLHLHLIPRYDGDLQDPRGGIRWVLPKKAKYWP